MKKILLSICLLLFISSKGMAQCVAQFNYYYSPPTLVSFIDSSFSSGGPITYQWDFGDGSPADTSANPVHTYSVAGNYNVCLIISDGLGCSDTSCMMINVNPPQPFVTLSYFDVDSMGLFSCNYPQLVSFYYYGSATNYPPTDSVKVEVRYGDGVDSIFYLSCSTPQIGGQLMHIYQNAGTYTAQLVLTGPNMQADSNISQTIIISSSCGPLSGNVYNDLNHNCINDPGEELAFITLELYSGSQLSGWVQTDQYGHYSFSVPTGNTYDIHIISSGGYSAHFTPSCPTSGIITASVPSSNNDFGIVCPTVFDLQGGFTGWRFRPGFIGTVCVHAYNQWCNTPSGQIDIVVDPLLTPLPDTGGIGYTINGNTVSYVIDSTNSYWSFCFPVMTSTSAQIGDSVCITMNITPTAGDSLPSNNTFTHCYAVTNSWDPNDKSSSPGEGQMGYIRPNTPLTYTIRFQNTGSAEAVNIYILDSLDASLDVSTLEVLGSSHPMHHSVLTGNILRFNFDNINLADSVHNEPASHGYVTYRINQKSNVPQLTQITNTAGIYFDFNPAVITNTTVNTVDQFLSVSNIKHSNSLVNVYPNPANGKCSLYFKDNSNRTIIVSDVLGKEVFRTKSNADLYILNTDKYSEGNYMIQITDERNNPETIKLIISH